MIRVDDDLVAARLRPASIASPYRPEANGPTMVAFYAGARGDRDESVVPVLAAAEARAIARALLAAADDADKANGPTWELAP